MFVLLVLYPAGTVGMVINRECHMRLSCGRHARVSTVTTVLGWYSRYSKCKGVSYVTHGVGGNPGLVQIVLYEVFAVCIILECQRALVLSPSR